MNPYTKKNRPYFVRRLFIFLRASLIVLFTTSNIFLISKGLYVAAICLSAGISTMWTLNVKDLAICNWQDRIAYILGGVVGTSLSQYILDGNFRVEEFKLKEED